MPETVDRTPQNLRVLLANEQRDALDTAAAMIRELGYTVAARAVSIDEVSRIIAEEEEDVDAALVVLHDDQEHALDMIDRLVDEAPCPIVVLIPREGPDFVEEAAIRGVFAYVRPMRPDAIRGALEVAIRRHDELTSAQRTVGQLESALERRGTIEQAKGILMERRDLEGPAAFALMREEARRTQRKVIDVAQAVITGRALLSRRP